MENYSTLSRDKTFRKRAYTTIFFIIFSIAAIYGLVFSAENLFGGTRTSGSSGSSYATINEGARAWSDLLAINGHEVTRDRGRVTLPELSYLNESYNVYESEINLKRRTETVVVLNGALPSDESEEVKDFVESGGRLITDNPYLLEDLLGLRLQVNVESSPTLYPFSDDVAGLADITKISASSYGSLEMKNNPSQRPLLVSNRNASSNSSGSIKKVGAAIFKLEGGDVIAIPNSPIVSNELLAQDDNALFSLLIAGSPESSVTFMEGVHGYDEATGFAGMPMNWRVSIVGLFVAFVIFATAKGRRFGVGEQTDRDLGPRRIYFAHALAQTLKKSWR